ncbi:MAG: NUDIX domain-containing protein [Piscirickettsiaceae bacterium]|nr:MAG: NUDIX domain-containing protein [Piscirickettsiaceae bacterium]
MMKKAAALILVRDTEKGIEVCMLKRVNSSRFAAGAYVFPGGAIEEQDKVFCLAMGEPEDQTPKISAIRETLEEANILSAILPSTQRINEQQRALLNAGKVTFQSLMQNCELQLSLEDVLFYDHWITPEGAPIRFDTRFYLAKATSEHEVMHDDSETDASCWALPSSLLELHGNNEIKLMPVTHVQLTRLANINSVDELFKEALQKQDIKPTLPVLNFNSDGKPSSVSIQLEEGLVKYPTFMK